MSQQKFKTPPIKTMAELREKSVPTPSAVELENIGFSDLQGFSQKSAPAGEKVETMAMPETFEKASESSLLAQEITGKLTALPGEIGGFQLEELPEDPETQNPYIVNVRDNHGFLLFQYDASKNQILIKRRAKTNENIPAAVYRVDMRHLASVGNRNIISDNPVDTFIVSETA